MFGFCLFLGLMMGGCVALVQLAARAAKKNPEQSAKAAKVIFGIAGRMLRKR
jgi:hypothetical protein